MILRAQSNHPCSIQALISMLVPCLAGEFRHPFAATINFKAFLALVRVHVHVISDAIEDRPRSVLLTQDFFEKMVVSSQHS
jgi:hypothetical protein